MSRRARLSGLVDKLPEAVSARLRSAAYRYRPSDVPPPPPRLDSEVRLYIGPANFAGQGFAWARAVENLPGVRAHSAQFRTPGMQEFPVDTAVPVNVYRFSRRWQRREFEAVAAQYTHVLMEAARPLFGPLFGDSAVAEVAALRGRGVSVALVSHGSDLRDPRRHAEIDEWSPFDGTWDREPGYRRQAAEHRALLAQSGAPLFVSTPDLLLDWTPADYLPLVVHATRWTSSAPPLVAARPKVVHVPSGPHIKGTAMIAPTMAKLQDEGLVDYRQLQDVPFAEMPRTIGESDIVLEQFRLGAYGVTAVEAMAAGRLVVAHLHEQVRQAIRDVSGREIPIVSATPATLETVLRGVVADPQRYAALAAEGPDFVRALHDGRASGAALARFLGVA